MALTPDEKGVILSRNVLFRAWKGSGVPLDVGAQAYRLPGLEDFPLRPGRWTPSPGKEDVRLYLYLRCVRCGAAVLESLWDPFTAERLLAREHIAVLRLGEKGRCFHLTALRKKPSKEVLYLAELEVLSDTEV